jgi:hypothetical protein
MKTGVTVRGGARLRAAEKALGGLPDSLMDTLANIVGGLVEHHVQGPAQDKAPQDTGALMESLNTEIERRGKGIVASVVSAGTANSYAEVEHEREDLVHPVSENRRSRVAPQDHFLHNETNSGHDSAYEENKEALAEDIEYALASAAERALAGA